MTQPWIDAAIAGDGQKIKELIARGGEPEMNSLGQTPLMIAALRGHEACVQLLLPVSDPSQKSGISGRTAFEEAIEKEQIGVAAILITRESANAKNPETGSTRLMQAIEKGKMGLAALLMEWSDLEAEDRQGRRAMHWAAAARPGAIEALIKKGAKPDAPDASGQRPLLAATQAGNKEAVEKLLRTPGVVPAARDLTGRSAFAAAAASGRRDLALLLMEWASVEELEAAGEAFDLRAHGRGAIFSDEAKIRNGLAPSAHGAAEALSREHARALMAMDPQKINQANELKTAARSGDADRVAKLLRAGAPAMSDSMGYTPLIVAALHGYVECVRELLPACDPNALALGMTALEMALKNNHEACAQLLLPATNLAERDSAGKTALMRAALSGRHKWIDLLLPGSDPLDKDSLLGRTALMHAAVISGDGAAQATIQCVRRLVDSSDANAQDANGMTALMLAIEAGNTKAAKMLASASDPRLANQEGMTALMLACGARRRGHGIGSRPEGAAELAELLLAGSDPDARDEEGLSAFDWAARRDSIECMDIAREGATLRAAEDALKRHQRKKKEMPRLLAWAESLQLKEAVLGGGANGASAGAESQGGQPARGAPSPAAGPAGLEAISDEHEPRRKKPLSL